MKKSKLVHDNSSNTVPEAPKKLSKKKFFLFLMLFAAYACVIAKAAELDRVEFNPDAKSNS